MSEDERKVIGKLMDYIIASRDEICEYFEKSKSPDKGEAKLYVFASIHDCVQKAMKEFVNV